jgi:Tfp pilus assembly protein PilZ
MTDTHALDQKPIRLKVVYKSPQSLVTRYTSSVSKGGCVIQTTRPLEAGTRFVFEMFASGDDSPVEVEGEVTGVEPAGDGQFKLSIRYTPTRAKRQNLERLLDRIFNERPANEVRAHARIPVNLVAVDEDDEGVLYLVRDLSMGGIGLRLGSERELPDHVRLGSVVDLVVKAKGDAAYRLRGEVVWTTGGGSGLTRAGFGVRFVPLKESDRRVVASLQRLHRPEKVCLSVREASRKVKGKLKRGEARLT